MLCEILYLDKSDKDRFVDLRKRIENYYVFTSLRRKDRKSVSKMVTHL